MEQYSLFLLEGDTYRVLTEEIEGRSLVIDVSRMTMPQWMSVESIESAEVVSESALPQRRGIDGMAQEDIRTMELRYTAIAPILPCLADDGLRFSAIRKAAADNGLSTKTVKNYLCTYLAYQSKEALAPSEKAARVLSADEKNFRWALNKFFYTRHGKNLADTFTALLQSRYSDAEGRILPDHPSINSFRRYYRAHRSLQKLYITQEGIKGYQKDYRPLLGENVQQFAPVVGYGLLDSTICDIYLVDDKGDVVGRPILTVCVDAYSGLCCGYSLNWEGGMYSIRSMMFNCVADKVEWCRRFGIEISRDQWWCSDLMGVYVTDKGTEFASKTFEQVSELGCKLVNLPAYRPELKGRVEKLFDLIQDSYRPHLKGRGVIERDHLERGARDYRKDACITMKDFEAIVIHSILFHNNRRVQAGFPYTEDMLERKVEPYASAIWNYARRMPGANLIAVPVELLVKTLLPRCVATFTRRGLVANRLRYGCEGYTEQFLQGGKAVVAYNPDDVSVVYLVADGYCEFSLIDARYDGLTLVEVENRRRAQKELVGACAEANLQARVDLANHIKTIAERSAAQAENGLGRIRDTRESERENAHRDFVKEVSNG